MSDAINRAKAEADRNGDPQAFEAMLIELAETVQRMSMWEVEYIAVKDRRRVTVTNTVDAAAVAAEVAKLIPRAKVRKLKVKRAEPVREVTHVPGWGTIDVYQAAGEMQKLVRDIGEARQQRDSMREERNEALRANVELLAERDQSAVAFGNLQRDLAALRHALNDSNDDRHRMRQLLDDGRLAVDKAHQAVKTVLEGDQ